MRAPFLFFGMMLFGAACACNIHFGYYGWGALNGIVAIYFAAWGAIEEARG